MNVNIPKAVTVPAQSQAAAAPQGGKTSSGGDFQQTLVQQIQSNTSAETNSTSSAAVPAAPAQGAQATASLDGLPPLSELIALIDGLLDALEQADSSKEQPVLTEEQLAELEAAMDQLSALLALLGIPVITMMPPADQQTLETMPKESQTALQGAVVRSNMQDMLLQLQAAMEQGAVKHVQKQEPTPLIAEQLQALTALVNRMKGAGAPELDQEGLKAQELYQTLNSKTSDAGSMLQRLSEQTANHSLLSAAVKSEGASESNLQAETNASQQQIPVPAGGASLQQADIFKNALQMAARQGNAPVPADQFAETMTGMIVQKFDIRTLNGISEAKLMLYPEHMGQVDVKITMQNGQLQALFLTDTAMAKDVLDNQMAQLRAALQSQGLVVDKLEVAQSSSAAGLLGQHKGQGNSQQQFTNQQSSNNRDGNADASIEAEASELAVAQGLGFGRGINVTA